TVSHDTQGFTAFILHGGVPLALANSGHFSFQVVPEMNLGFATSTISGPPDTHVNGFHLDIGAHAGAEIHFGFIGIPQLSLQGSMDPLLKTEHASHNIDAYMGAPESKTSLNSTTIRTTVGDNPWNIFTSNVAALYYF